MTIYFADYFTYNNYSEVVATGKWQSAPTGYRSFQVGEDTNCTELQGFKPDSNTGDRLYPYSLSIPGTGKLCISTVITIKGGWTNASHKLLVGLGIPVVQDHNVEISFYSTGSPNYQAYFYVKYKTSTYEIITLDKIYTLHNFRIDIVYSEDRLSLDIYVDNILVVNTAYDSRGVVIMHPHLYNFFDYDDVSNNVYPRYGIRALIISDERLYPQSLCLGPLPNNNRDLIDALDTHNGTFNGKEHWQKEALTCG